MTSYNAHCLHCDAATVGTLMVLLDQGWLPTSAEGWNCPDHAPLPEPIGTFDPFPLSWDFATPDAVARTVQSAAAPLPAVTPAGWDAETTA